MSCIRFPAHASFWCQSLNVQYSVRDGRSTEHEGIDNLDRATYPTQSRLSIVRGHYLS